MAILQDFAELLTVSTGSLTYHLVTLFVTQIVLGMAVVHWRRRRASPTGFRLVVMAVAVALMRLVLILLAVLHQLGFVAGDAIAPPLERFVDLATLFLATWAFLPVLYQYKRIASTLLLTGLVVGGGIYVVSTFLWLRRMLEGEFFNHYWQSSAWELLSIALLVPTMIVAALSRRADWGLRACLFGVWLAGHALEYAVPVADANSAGWVRLADLAALPLLASLVFREALQSASSAEPTVLLDLLRSLGSIRTRAAREPEATGFQPLVAALSGVLDADAVALGLTIPDRAGAVHIVAVHPPVTGGPAGRGVVLSASEHPLLADALGDPSHSGAIVVRGDEVVSATPSEGGHRVGHDPLVSTSGHGESLLRDLGLKWSSPLLVQPLSHGGETVGVLLAACGTREREWTAVDRRILEATGAALATVLGSASGVQAPQDDGALRQALDRERDLVRRAAALQRQLAEQQRQLDDLNARTATARERMHGQDRGPLPSEQAPASIRTPPEGSTQSKEIVSLAPQLRRPTTSIMGYTKLLLDGAAGRPSEMQHHFLQRIAVNAASVDGILSRFLRTNAPHQREPDANGSVDVSAVLDEAITSLTDEARKRNLTLRSEIEADLPPADGDPDAITQAVLSILSNACAVSREGTEVLVRARLTRLNGRPGMTQHFVLISVRDTGGGISPSDQERLFHRSQRADNRPMPGVAGGGTGLLIAKTLIEAQGGRAWAESAIGVGTTLSLAIPVSLWERRPSTGKTAGRSAEV